MKTKIIALTLCLITFLLAFSSCASCNKNQAKRPDAFVIMTEDLDGLFNPFYSTTASDATIVSMTQISMLGSAYENGDVKMAYGDNYAVAVKDFDSKYNAENKTTTYTFVLKNGITFSDGTPLTMNDVLFNLYVYLDPVYSGSSTMYSTDIVGLKDYRTQTVTGSGTDADDAISKQASDSARTRIAELINLYRMVGKQATAGKYSASYEDMVNAIKNHKPSKGYCDAVSAKPETVTSEQLLADYELALKLFRKELETDYAGAKDAFKEEPYKSTGKFDEVTSFMYTEGYVEIKYAKDENNKDIKSKIEEVIPLYNTDTVKDMESAINYVYTSKVEQELDLILQVWGTAQKLRTEFAAKAKEVILHRNLKDGQLVVPNIKGIVSLGHTGSVSQVVCNDNTYTVAKNHNADGTVANAEEYDVLQITINGVDPKAVWNFAFSVAPHHYYAEGYEVDIANNKFGVEWATFSYMKDVIQSQRNVKLPMGAGAYKVTDADNSDAPDLNAFFSNNVVYFKRNDKFLLGVPKIEKIRYQVVSASNAISALESGSVHYVTPQFTQNNIDKLNSLAEKGIQKTYTDQLGYGYIGINAGLVPDINIRKAIMSAMNTSLALSYYSTGMAETIYWPMSTVSWAYPKAEDGSNSRDNGHDYPSINFNKEDAKAQILNYMEAAGVSAGDSKLSIKFTIAGSNLTDHPTYQTFQGAADLLNECGWDIEVVPDTQALTKLSSGSLAVWAAAWGSTVDPDLYQVYHKNSTATSTLAWGYREILENPGAYPEENSLLNQLSNKIDEARETEDRADRTELYKEAMGYILDMAIELPVYQRKVLYAYNGNVINADTLPSMEEINPYSSPLDRIWEIDFAA